MASIWQCIRVRLGVPAWQYADPFLIGTKNLASDKNEGVVILSYLHVDAPCRRDMLLLTESTIFFLNRTFKRATSSTDPVALKVKNWVSGIDTTASGIRSSTFIDDELCPVVEEPELSLTTLVRSRKTRRAATSVRV